MTRKLSAESLEILLQGRFSKKAPNAFSLGGDLWLHNVPVLYYSRNGRLEISYPSYNTQPTSPDDEPAQRALDELNALLEEVVIDIYIAPGDWVCWDNSALVHRRGKIGEGRRKLLRNYIRGDCDAMRLATGQDGPIFSARDLLNAVGVTNEGQSHVV